MFEPTSYKILIDTLKAIPWQYLFSFNLSILSHKHAIKNAVIWFSWVVFIEILVYVDKQERRIVLLMCLLEFLEIPNNLWMSVRSNLI